jgi:hypothetical protein
MDPSRLCSALCRHCRSLTRLAGGGLPQSLEAFDYAGGNDYDLTSVAAEAALGAVQENGVFCYGSCVGLRHLRSARLASQPFASFPRSSSTPQLLRAGRWTR